MTNRYINEKNSRREDQKKVMKQIAEDEVCPFCTEHLTKYHKKPILKEGEHWLFSENQWPYVGVKRQFIFILKKHKEHLSELTEEEGAELMSIAAWASKEYNMPGGGLAMRFGSNPEHGDYGSSVLHLHAHLIEPDLENLPEETDHKFKFKFGQKKKD